MSIESVQNHIDQLRSADSQRRIAATWVLAGMGTAATAAIPALVLVARSDTDPGLRRSAGRALGQISLAGAAPTLIAALTDDPDAAVRRSALRVLGQMGGVAVVRALARSLTHDPDPDIRADVAWTLGQIGDCKAVPALTKALRDTERFVQWSALRALGQIVPGAVPALARSLTQDPDPVPVPTPRR